MVDFSLSDEEQAIQETVRKFADSEIRPHARAWEEAHGVAADTRAKVTELGFVPMLPAPSAEDSEHGLLADCIIAEELARGDPGAAFALLAPAWANQLALRAGFPKDQLGDGHGALAALGVTSDGDNPGDVVAEIENTEDGGYVLTGRKCLVPVVSESDPEWLLVSSGAALFLVPGDAAGMTWEDDGDHLGLLACPTRTVTLDHVRIPRAHAMLAEHERGWNKLWDRWRLGIAALLLGLSRAAYEHALAYAKEREAFGQPIAKYQSIAFMLVNMDTEIDASRLLLQRAATHIGAADTSDRDTLMALAHVHAASLRITEDAVQILGGHGYCQDHPVEMWMRDARILTLYAGYAPALDESIAHLLSAA